MNSAGALYKTIIEILTFQSEYSAGFSSNCCVCIQGLKVWYPISCAVLPYKYIQLFLCSQLVLCSDVSPSVKVLQNCIYLSYLLVHSDSKGMFLENVNYFHSYIL